MGKWLLLAAIVGRLRASLYGQIQANVRTWTTSLGTGLSCFADHSICSSDTICLVRECPLHTVSDRAVEHATGTPALTTGPW
jgi:hypothetical protein